VITLAGVEEHIDRMYIPRQMGGDCDYEPDYDAMEDAPWCFA
jgi:hypothetical protein